jgi:hypothetical protein
LTYRRDMTHPIDEGYQCAGTGPPPFARATAWPVESHTAVTIVASAIRATPLQERAGFIPGLTGGSLALLPCPAGSAAIRYLTWMISASLASLARW